MNLKDIFFQDKTVYFYKKWYNTVITILKKQNMQFKIAQHKDKLTDEAYNKAMIELNEFYEINWKYNKPHIIIIDDRKTIDAWRGFKTGEWNAAWADKNKWIFILNRKNLEKESNHAYSKETYFARINHELSHSFFYILSQNGSCPSWFKEGLSIYTSGQNRWKQVPEKFKLFLSFNKQFCNEGGIGLYGESGFVVKLLIEKFGKKKLLNLIKQSKNSKNNTDFKKLFAKIYGFNLNYRNINNLYNKKIN